MAGTLACARGDLAAAEAHLAAQLAVLGRDPVPPDYNVIEDQAELALWQEHPEVATGVARDGMIVTAQDALRCALVIWLGLRAEADLAELARAQRDAPAEAGACERARVPRDGPRARRRRRPPRSNQV